MPMSARRADGPNAGRAQSGCVCAQHMGGAFLKVDLTFLIYSFPSNGTPESGNDTAHLSIVNSGATIELRAEA